MEFSIEKFTMLMIKSMTKGIEQPNEEKSERL